MDRTNSQTRIDRRSFVKGSALGGAAVACAATLPTAARAAEAAAPADANADVADIPAWLGVEPEVAASDIADTKETTLLVIGAGTAGLACAATAVDMGLDFILAEKLSVTAESREYLGAVNSHLITEAGLDADKGKLLNELSRYASGKCDRDLIKMWIDESAEVVDWIEPMLNAAGQRFILPDYAAFDEQAGGTEYYAPHHRTHDGYLLHPAEPQRSHRQPHHADRSRDRLQLGAREARARGRRSERRHLRHR